MRTISKAHHHLGYMIPLKLASRTKRQWQFTNHFFIHVGIIDVQVDLFSSGNDDAGTITLNLNIGGRTADEKRDKRLQAQYFMQYRPSPLFRRFHGTLSQL